MFRLLFEAISFLIIVVLPSCRCFFVHFLIFIVIHSSFFAEDGENLVIFYRFHSIFKLNTFQWVLFCYGRHLLESIDCFFMWMFRFCCRFVFYLQTIWDFLTLSMEQKKSIKLKYWINCMQTDKKDPWFSREMILDESIHDMNIDMCITIYHWALCIVKCDSLVQLCYFPGFEAPISFLCLSSD